MVRESPEIAAVVRRIGEAWRVRDYETYSNLISNTPHFRGIGTDADEYWDTPEMFLRIRQVQLAELDAQRGSEGPVERTLERIDAFEEGSVGWATMLYALHTPDRVVNIRATAVLVLEAGAWRVVQWHSSVPTPNVQTFGVELTTTLDDLLAAVAEDPGAMDTLGRSEGTTTLVFTDIVDSTLLAERVGDEGWVALVKDHEADIRRLTARHHGEVVKMLGDGSMLAFDSARAAVRAALDIRNATGDDFAVRIGVHVGEVVHSEGDLLGVTVNKAARVASIADGGQVLVSSLVAEMVGSMDGLAFGPPEMVTLKGLSGTHAVHSLEAG